MQEKAPNCYECAYFKVSWDSKFPKGCHKFGFSCRQLPSIEVLAATGQQCIYFHPKPSEARATYQPIPLLPEHSTMSVLG